MWIQPRPGSLFCRVTDVHWPRPPMSLFDRHVKQPITVCFVQRYVSGRGNVSTKTDRVWNSRMYFNDSMPWTLIISQTFENPALTFVVTFVNTTAFFFREGVFVSRRNVKVRDTHISQKSCIIQPIRRWLWHSWVGLHQPFISSYLN